MSPRFRILVAGAMVALVVAQALPGRAFAAISAIAVVREGNPAPGGNGSFGGYASYGEPCVNHHSQVAFTTLFNGTLGGAADNDALVRADASGTVTVMAREGQPLPDGPGAFGALHAVLRQYAMNDSGRIAIVAPLTGTPGGAGDNLALYSAVFPGLWWKHARRGESAPSTSSTYNSILPPQINDQPPAAVAFMATTGTSSVPGLVYVDRLGLTTRVTWAGQPAPDATDADGLNGTVASFPAGDPPALRRTAAEIAIWAHLSGTTFASQDDDGIFRASADVFVDLARGHQPAPGGGTYGEMASPVYNSDGIAAFRSNLYPTSAGEAITLDWPFGGELCAFKNQLAGDGNGKFTSLWDPALNDAETVAFKVQLTATAGGGLDDMAIYKCDSPYTPVPALDDQLAREGQAPPEGNGVFANFGDIVAINGPGQVLFTATLRSTAGGTSDDRGLYLWDPAAGLVKLVREGDVIDGRTVLAFSTLTQRDFGGYGVLNDLGEAVARVDMSGSGGDGIYLFRYAAETAVAPPGAVGPRAAALTLALAPNPVARGPVAVEFSRRSAGPLRVTVHDLAGRLVRTVQDGTAPARGACRWDGLDGGGARVAGGVYFVAAVSGAESATRRLVVIP